MSSGSFRDARYSGSMKRVAITRKWTKGIGNMMAGSQEVSVDGDEGKNPRVIVKSACQLKTTLIFVFEESWSPSCK